MATGFSEAWIFCSCAFIFAFRAMASAPGDFQPHVLGLDKARYTSDCMT